MQFADVTRGARFGNRPLPPSTAKLALLILAVCAPVLCAAEPRVFPTGVTIYDPAQAYNGYVLFGAADGMTYLIDMDGHEVRTWKEHGFPSELLSPAVASGERGHVLMQLSGDPGPFQGLFHNRTIGEVDWNDEIVWQWGKSAPGGAARQNHDWHRLANGNTLIVATIDHRLPWSGSREVPDQVIYEVTRGGGIVWSWTAGDHLQEFGFPAAGLALMRKGFSFDPTNEHGFLTINSMKAVGPNHWFDAGDKRFKPDNILINSREGNFVAIVDKRTGHIVWRLGPYPGAHAPFVPRPYDPKVPRPLEQLSGEHDPQIIPEGLPGAGNLLVFDNEGPAGWPPTNLAMDGGSRVLEIDPVHGNIVWQYTGENSDRPIWSFLSTFISSARRLPNGNTLIDEGLNGRFFQVTSAGHIVWEYVSPHFARDVVGERSVLTNYVYRAQPVPYDWVPSGTQRTEVAVVEPDIRTFRVPGSAHD